MYERPFPEYLEPEYIAAEDLSLAFGLTVDEVRRTLQDARVACTRHDGHDWYAEVIARAALVEHRGKGTLVSPEPEPVAEELSIEAVAAGSPYVDEDGETWTHRAHLPPGA